MPMTTVADCVVEMSAEETAGTQVVQNQEDLMGQETIMTVIPTMGSYILTKRSVNSC